MAIRIYADTSVYGGVFDSGIDVASRGFFEQVKSGYFELVTSSAVADELATDSCGNQTSCPQGSIGPASAVL